MTEEIMHNVSWIKRVVTPIGFLIFPTAILAILVAEPQTPRTIFEAFFVGLAAPFSSHWLIARFTGPIRHTLLVVFFVVLPILLFPAYTLRPQKSTAILTGIGTVLWLFSCFLTLAVVYLDD